VLWGLRAFDTLSRRTLGGPIRRRVRVVLAARDWCLVPAAHRVIGVANGRTICLFAYHANYPTDPGRGAQAVAHEAAHVLLDEQAGCTRPPLGRRPPAWLLEGMAEDLGWRAVRPSSTTAELADDARARAATERHPRGLSYGAAELRTLQLEDGHPRRLVTFCRAVGAGTSWRTAATRVFGVAP
jgi:hypothetical protein